jgi:hypothetical protein
MLPLSHRQRLWMALNYREPDRVPLDLGTRGNTSPVPEVYAGRESGRYPLAETLLTGGA